MEGYSCGIRYAGEYLDSETGEYYLRARYYDPYVGRFTTEDTYEDPNNSNQYVYCANDPIQYIDPTGHILMYNTNAHKVEFVPNEVVSSALATGYQSLASRTNAVGVTNASASVPVSLFTPSGGGNSSGESTVGNSISTGGSAPVKTKDSTPPPLPPVEKKPQAQVTKLLAVPEQPNPVEQLKVAYEANKETLGASGIDYGQGNHVSYADLYQMIDKLGVQEPYRGQILQMLKQRPKIIAPSPDNTEYSYNVELLQRLLNGLWFNTGGIDGYWGGKTQSSIKAIDTYMHTGYEGGVNEQTWVEGIVGLLVKYSSANEKDQEKIRQNLWEKWQSEYDVLLEEARREESLKATVKDDPNGTISQYPSDETRLAFLLNQINWTPLYSYDIDGIIYYSNVKLDPDALRMSIKFNEGVQILNNGANIGVQALSNGANNVFQFFEDLGYATWTLNPVPDNLPYGTGFADNAIGGAMALVGKSGKFILKAGKAGEEADEIIDFGKYLKSKIGSPPSGMIDPHAHHILFKEGLGEAQKALVKEGQALLRKYDIDPILGVENLTWAPMRVQKQHDIETLKNVVNALKEVENYGGSKDFIRKNLAKKLKELGELAARKGN